MLRGVNVKVNADFLRGDFLQTHDAHTSVWGEKGTVWYLHPALALDDLSRHCTELFQFCMMVNSGTCLPCDFNTFSHSENTEMRGTT